VVTGLNGREVNAQGAYFWTAPNATVILDGFWGRPALLDLQLTSPRPPDAPPAIVRLRSGTWESTPFLVQGDWRRYQIVTPPVDHATQQVRLDVTAFRPATGDGRNLGVAIRSVDVTLPTTTTWRTPPLLPIIFALPLPLLTYLAVVQLNRYRDQPRRYGRSMQHLVSRTVALLSFVGTLLFVVAAILFPGKWGYIIPSLYILLGILSIVIARQYPWVRNRFALQQHSTMLLLQSQPVRSICAILLLVYFIVALFVPFPRGVTRTNGDEPHYLITAHSIYHDHDVDIVNNYENEDYLAFYSGDLKAERHLKYYKDRTVLHHIMPGVPLIIMPAYAVAGLTGVHLFLSMLMAWAMICLYRTSRCYVPQNSAWIITVILGLTYPIIAYSQAIFPESLAFFLVAFIISQIIAPPDQFFRLRTIAVGGALGLLPHLNFKMGVLSLLLFIFWLWTERRHMLALIIWSSGPIFLFAVLFFTWLYSQYGELSPEIFGALPGYARYQEESSVLQGSLGLFFDQKFGLFFNAPLYTLSFSGLWLLWRNRATRQTALFLTLIYATYHMMHGAYINWSTGGSPAPRYIISVLPILVIATTCGVAACWQRWQRFQIIVLSCLGIWITLLYLNNRGIMYEFSGREHVLFSHYQADTILSWLPGLRYGTPLEAYPRLLLVLGLFLLFWYLSRFANVYWVRRQRTGLPVE
jgi:hypothetical protein